MSTNDALKPAPGWSRSTGHSQVKHMTADPETSRALDRLLIAERIFRYGWAYDERDREGLGDCFAENGIWEGSIMGISPVGPFQGRAAIVDWLADFWKIQFDQRRHVFTNVIVDSLTSTEATAYAYLILTASSDSTMTPQTAGPYKLSMIKEADGVWRMSRLVGGFDAPF